MRVCPVVRQIFIVGLVVYFGNQYLCRRLGAMLEALSRAGRKCEV